ncbi:Crp/Fnr family transcriptional regulator [Brevundimonas sp.]
MASVLSAEHSGNGLLESMDEDDQIALDPHLRRMTVEKDQILIEQDTRVREVHFPIGTELSNVMAFSDGRVVEISTVGSEGLSGLAAFLAEAPCAWRVTVREGDTVIALSAAALRKQVAVSPRLLKRLMLLTHDNQSQGAQNAACNAIHDSTSRLARWILTLCDRTGREALELTQEEMSVMLGVQRTTVSAGAAELKRQGAISYARGALRVENRRRLEAAACECYVAQRIRTDKLGLAPGQSMLEPDD